MVDGSWEEGFLNLRQQNQKLFRIEYEIVKESHWVIAYASRVCIGKTDLGDRRRFGRRSGGRARRVVVNEQDSDINYRRLKDVTL